MALTLNYNGPFEWQADLLSGPSANVIQAVASNASVDMYGNFYTVGRAFDRTSALVWDGLTDVDLIAAINTWHGSVLIPGPDFAPNHIVATPILSGTRLLTSLKTKATVTTFHIWWVILQVPPPSSFNHLVVTGVIRYETLLGVFRVFWSSTLIMNGQTENDPILILGDGGLGLENFREFFALIPSVFEMESRAYAGGWGGAFTAPYLIPYAYYDLPPDLDLFFANPVNTEDGLGTGYGAVFSLPGPGDSTNIYQYLSHSRMEYERLGGTGGTLFCPEIKNVIQPANPLGQMVKTNILNTNFFTAMSFAIANNIVDVEGGYLVDSLAYTLDGSNWGIPWTDEWTYLSNGKVGGNDSYMCTVSYHGQLPSGEWFVAFIMPGADDANVNFAFPSPFDVFKRMQEKAIRGFIYDPGTGAVTTTFPRVKGIAYTNHDIDFPVNYAGIKNECEILDPIQTGPDSYDMHIYGTTFFAGPVWRTRLHQLAPRPWLQVNW